MRDIIDIKNNICFGHVNITYLLIRRPMKTYVIITKREQPILMGFSKQSSLDIGGPFH